MALTPEQRDAIRSDLKWLITRSGLTAAEWFGRWLSAEERGAGNGGAVSEYKIPAEVLEQAAAAARNNATKDLSFDLGGWDTAPEVVREQWRTVVRIAAPLIAADAYRAGQAAAGREIAAQIQFVAQNDPYARP